jgi:hypothetical protein
MAKDENLANKILLLKILTLDMKKLAILFLIITALACRAQDFEVPANYVFKKPADFAAYEADIVKCYDWLMKTPSDKELEKRQDAGAFLMGWLSGNPDLTIDVNPKIVNFMDANPDLLLIFVGGWGKYAITSKENNKTKGNMAGLDAVIQYYQKNRDKLQKDKHVEKYIKMKDAGELEAFVKNNAG